MNPTLVLMAAVLVGALLLILPLIGRGPDRRSLAIAVAGVDHRFLVSTADRTRFTSAGSMVFLTASAAGAAMVAALSIVFPRTPPAAFVPLGLLWGVIVLSIDRWIVSTVDHGPIEANEPPGTAWQRHGAPVTRFLVRLLMATVIGLVITEPITLKLFAPEIAQRLQADHQEAIQQQTDAINAQYASLPTDPRGTVALAKTAYDNAVADEQYRHTVYMCELYFTPSCLTKLPPGTVSGVSGAGPQTQQAYDAWQLALKAVAPAEDAYQRALQAQQTDVISTNDADRRAATAAMIDRVNNDNGLLAQERALGEVIQADPALATQRWVVWGAIMLVDLLPLLLTVLSPRSQYQRLERAAAIRRVRNVTVDAVEDTDATLTERRAVRATRSHPSENRLRDLAEARDIAQEAAAERAEQRAEDRRRRTEARRGTTRPSDAAAAAAASSPAGSGSGMDGAGSSDHQAAQEPGVPAALPPAADRSRQGPVVGGRWALQHALPGVVHSTRIPPYLALDLFGQHQEPVVVKLIADPPGKGDDRQLRRALNEMVMPVGKIHDNLAPVLDSDIDPVHGCYVVTPYYKRTLQDYLNDPANAGQITLLQALTWLRQIVDGLTAAWVRGYVHLDVKPANMGLSDDLQIKLLDFGLLRNFEAVNGNLGTSNAAGYTTFYAPPEQMDRRGEWISRSADLHAVAATFYRILTGHPPLFLEAALAGLIDPNTGTLLDEDRRFDLKELIRDTNPLLLTELLHDLPQEVAYAVARWLDRDPAFRNPGNPSGFIPRLQMRIDQLLNLVIGRGVGDMVVGPGGVEPSYLVIDRALRRSRRQQERRARRSTAGRNGNPPPNRQTRRVVGGTMPEDPPTVVPPPADDQPTQGMQRRPADPPPAQQRDLGAGHTLPTVPNSRPATRTASRDRRDSAVARLPRARWADADRIGRPERPPAAPAQMYLDPPTIDPFPGTPKAPTRDDGTAP